MLTFLVFTKNLYATAYMCINNLSLCHVNISSVLVGNCILLVDNDMYFSVHFGTTMTKTILNLFIASTCAFFYTNRLSLL